MEKPYTLVMTNIARENGPFIGDLPMKMVIFHGYVKLPEGTILVFEFKAMVTWGSSRNSTVSTQGAKEEIKELLERKVGLVPGQVSSQYGLIMGCDG